MNITVVGTGAFGTALADRMISSKKTDNKVLMFGINKKEIKDINENHVNSEYYKKKLNSQLTATANPKKAFNDADIIILALPSRFVSKSIKETIIPNLIKPVYFINVAKGFDFIENKTLTEVVEDKVPKELNLGVLKLSGPSFALELMQKQPTLFVLAARKKAVADKLNPILSTKYIHIETTDNIMGVEWVSIIKNSMALFMGIVEGLGYKVNTRALFFSKALSEMKQILIALDINTDVLVTPAAVGDLFLTGTSKKSRNFETGFRIGKANKVTKRLLGSFATTEGIHTVEKLTSFGKSNKLVLNLTNMLYNITYGNEKPSKVIKNYFEEAYKQL